MIVLIKKAEIRKANFKIGSCVYRASTFLISNESKQSANQKLTKVLRTAYNQIVEGTLLSVGD